MSERPPASELPDVEDGHYAHAHTLIHIGRVQMWLARARQTPPVRMLRSIVMSRWHWNRVIEPVDMPDRRLSPNVAISQTLRVPSLHPADILRHLAASFRNPPPWSQGNDRRAFYQSWRIVMRCAVVSFSLRRGAVIRCMTLRSNSILTVDAATNEPAQPSNPDMRSPNAQRRRRIERNF